VETVSETESETEPAGTAQVAERVTLMEETGTALPETRKSAATPTIKEIQTQMRLARKALKKILGNAKKLRQDHMEDRAKMAAYDRKVTEANAINSIMKAESQRNSWSRIRRCMGKGKKSGLTHILIEMEDGTTECITEKEEMENKIIDRNISHFSQADGSPFTVSPLIDLLGRYGTSEEARQLLDGEFPLENEDLTEATKKILELMKRVSPEGAITDEITADDLRQLYAKWRETTSTSPSGLHLGHKKALLLMEKTEPSEDGKLTLSQQFFELKATFLNLAIRHGHVYKRWRTIVNATIEKIPGKPLLHKLHVIHLIESDFNLLIGLLFGRRLMAQAELNKSLGTEQKGARKGHEAISLVLDKQAKCSTSRLSKCNIASFVWGKVPRHCSAAAFSNTLVTVKPKHSSFQ
jgi:hypothetical protein